MTKITLNIPDELILKHGQLTSEEQKLWEQYQYLEHLVRLAKAKACLKIQDVL